MYKLLFGTRVYLRSDAEVIHIRNHLSVFFLGIAVRVKAYIPGGVRSGDDLINEWNIRIKNQLNHPKLRVPKLIKLVNKEHIIFYLDEVIHGERVNWDSHKSDDVSTLLLDGMIEYYDGSGICWRDFNELYPLAANKLSNLSESETPPNRSSIHKKILCSEIHGDLSLGNVILAADGVYVIDWELAKHGSVIGDLYKIMLKKPALVTKVERFFDRHKTEDIWNDDVKATFSEHLILESFVKDIHLTEQDNVS
jgi:hypothetical protein